MDERDTARILQTLPDEPVHPPQDFGEDLWARIASELAPPPSAPGRIEVGGRDRPPETATDTDTPPRPGIPGPVAAAAVFALVIAMGLAVWWLRPAGTGEVVVDTTSPTTTGEPVVSDLPVFPDGRIGFPDELFPREVTDAGDGTLVVRAELSAHESGTPPQDYQALLALDHATGEVTWIRSVGNGPSRMVTDGSSVWVAHFWTGEVTRLDRDTGETLARTTPELPFDVGSGPDRRQFVPNDLEIAFGSVWMSTARGAIARIDQETGETTEVIPISPTGEVPVSDIEVSERFLWIASDGAGLYRLDPETGNLDHLPSEALGHGTSSVVDTIDGVMVSGVSAESRGETTITIVDPNTLGLIDAVIVDAPSLSLMEVEGRVIGWSPPDRIWPLDVRPLVVGAPLEIEPVLLQSSGGRMWDVDPDGHTLAPVPLDTLSPPEGRLPDTGPLFGDETGVVLLFDDGLDGVLAVDPDRRLAARSVVEGQRGGDEPYSMVRVGDHLVVGWSRIYSVDIESREATSLGLATIFVPAAEDDRVWMIDYPGGAIGLGDPEVWQVSVDGERLTEPVTPDAEGMPVMGIPGGLAIETDEGGIVLWDAATGNVDDLRAGDHFVLDVGNGVIVSCESRCTSITVAQLNTLEEETYLVPFYNTFVPGPDFFRAPGNLSPNGRHLAVLVGEEEGPAGEAIWLLDRQTGQITIVDPPTPSTVEYLAWSPDGKQLFASSWSYGESQTTLWRYRLSNRSIDDIVLPFGGALTPVVINAEAADAYFGNEIEDRSDCPLPNPQDPRGICTFGF